MSLQVFAAVPMVRDGEAFVMPSLTVSNLSGEGSLAALRSLPGDSFQADFAQSRSRFRGRAAALPMALWAQSSVVEHRWNRSSSSQKSSMVRFVFHSSISAGAVFAPTWFAWNSGFSSWSILAIRLLAAGARASGSFPLLGRAAYRVSSAGTVCHHAACGSRECGQPGDAFIVLVAVL